jgi:environmental stress-induced protein Ves
MVLLRGLGLTLRFANGEQRALRKIGESVEFDGAVAAHCDLLNGPCVDLNFIVSKSVRAHARVEHVDRELLVRPTRLQSALIFSIADPLLLECDAGETVRLEPWDLAVLSQGGARLSKMEPDHYSAPSAVFFATINH